MTLNNLCVLVNMAALGMALTILFVNWKDSGIKRCSYSGCTMAVIFAASYFILECAWIIGGYGSMIGDSTDLVWAMQELLSLVTVYTLVKRLGVCGKVRMSGTYIPPPLKS